MLRKRYGIGIALVAALMITLAGCRVSVLITPSDDFAFNVGVWPFQSTAGAEDMFEDLIITFDGTGTPAVTHAEPTATETPLVIEFR